MPGLQVLRLRCSHLFAVLDTRLETAQDRLI